MEYALGLRHSSALPVRRLRAKMRPAALLLALAAMLPTLALAGRDHYEVLGLKSDSDDGV